VNRFSIKYFYLFLLLSITTLCSHAQSKHSNSNKTKDSISINLEVKKSAGINSGNSQLILEREVDSLKNILKSQKEDTNKVNIINLLTEKLGQLGYKDSSLQYAKSAIVLAEKIAFKMGKANALNNSGVAYYELGNYPMALKFYLRYLNISQEIGYKRGMIASYGNIGNLYRAQGNYPKALEYDFKSLTLSQEPRYKSYTATSLGNIGLIYQVMGDNIKALDYFFKALSINQEIKNNYSITIDFTNISLSYYQEKDYAKALEYCFKATALAQGIGYKNILTKDFEIIGGVYSDQNDLPKAQDYCFKALKIAAETGDIKSVAELYSDLGSLCIMLKKYKQARILLDSGLVISKTIGDRPTTKDNYRYLAQIDSATGNYKASDDEYKLYIIYRDSIINQESIQKITQMELNQQFQKIEDSIKVEQAKAISIKTSEVNRKRIVIYSITAILLIVIILAIFLINRQQAKRKKDKAIFEREKYQIENELAKSKATLDQYVKDLMEKNALLEQSNIDLESIKNLKAKEIDEERIEHLEDLNNATLLTEDDWDKFKDLFGKVYKGFFIRLKEKLPDLTPAEIRFICLTKLKLDTKQMASILVVSSDTIKKSRYRLRKKLGLSDDDNIEGVIASI